MTEVRYPIVIDQFYCPQGNCPTKVSHTKNIVMPITQICCLKDLNKGSNVSALYCLCSLMAWQ